MSSSKYKLALFGLPIVKSVNDLAKHLRLSPSLIFKMSTKTELFYREGSIPKRDGTTRTIYSPSFSLKAVQAWILRNILDKLNTSECATAFSKGATTLQNASFHRYANFLVRFDLLNFFNSIPYQKVFTIFSAAGYPLHATHILTSLCTYKRFLPQGAVTSPALSNLVCKQLDARLRGFANKRGFEYSRYADDIVFSSQSQRLYFQLNHFVNRIISEEGFELNHKKTLYAGPRSRKEVTGLVVGEGKVRLGRIKKRLLRAKIHRLATRHLSNSDKDASCHHINGWLSYINAVDPTSLKQLENYVKVLKSRPLPNLDRLHLTSHI